MQIQYANQETREAFARLDTPAAGLVREYAERFKDMDHIHILISPFCSYAQVEFYDLPAFGREIGVSVARHMLAALNKYTDLRSYTNSWDLDEVKAITGLPGDAFLGRCQAALSFTKEEMARVFYTPRSGVQSQCVFVVDLTEEVPNVHEKGI